MLCQPGQVQTCPVDSPPLATQVEGLTTALTTCWVDQAAAVFVCGLVKLSKSLSVSVHSPLGHDY